MTELPSALADALHDHYMLERELGRGGMATVYLARDLRHKREVALKLLDPEVGAAVGPERFLREIETAARLQHPHVLPVFDSGEAAGRLWYAMPYVEGESLRGRLEREGRLGVRDAVRLACEVAAALDYAHRKGVIHRDVKPENILLSDGHALVADFGIARAQMDSGPALTQTGISLGTPAYMSPEQALGERDLDGRTDVYALGCMLYELLVGRAPFGGASAQAIITAHLTKPIPSPRLARADLPEALDAAIMKALSKTREDRFGTAAAFATALGDSVMSSSEMPAAAPAGVPGERRPPWASRPRLLALCAVAVAAALTAIMIHRRADAAGATPRLAVLPFDNAGDSADAYFADGMTDAVRDKLAALPGLEVIASNSTGQYRETTKTPKEIGRELGARYLLFGKVRSQGRAVGGNRIQVRPELVDTRSGSERWGQPFDAAMTDVFDVQSEIAERVANALGVVLGAGQQQQLAHQPTTSLAAYDIVLRAEAALKAANDIGDFAGLRRALGEFERALQLDSSFVDAWRALAAGHTYLWQVDPVADDSAEARRAAERAVQLAPDSPDALRILGAYHEGVRGDFEAALTSYQSGLKLAPNNALLLSAIAVVERATGHWEEALAHAIKSQSLDPRCGCGSSTLGNTLHMLRRYPEALRAYERGRTLAPGDLSLLLWHAMVYLDQGDLAGARALIRAAPKQMDPTDVAVLFASAEDLFWVLDGHQQDTVLKLPADYPGFGGNRGYWGIVHAQIYWERGDSDHTHAWADSAWRGFDDILKAKPYFTKADQYALRGLASAYRGDKAAAIRDGQKGVARALEVRDPWDAGYIRDVMARIYVAVGEPELAIAQLDTLVSAPSFYSRAWFGVDPTLAPLRGRLDFERLLNAR